MIDFETLSTEANAVVAAIGAAWFDRKTGQVGKTLEMRVHLPAYLNDQRFHLDPNTILWWLQQERQAIQLTFFTGDTWMPDAAFQNLNDFVKGSERIWCHATFDFPILQYSLKTFGIKPNFKYTSCRDLRTLVDEAGYDYRNHPRQHVHHRALGDVLHQIDYAMACFRINGDL